MSTAVRADGESGREVAERGNCRVARAKDLPVQAPGIFIWQTRWGVRGSRWTALDLSPEGRSTDRAGDQTRRGRQRRGEGGVRGRVRFEWQIAATGERERERWARLGHGTCGLPPPHMTQPDATRPGPCRDRHRRSSRGRRSGARRCRLAPEERSRSWPCSRTEIGRAHV